MPLPHAWERSLRGASLGRGEGGGPAPPGLGCGTDVPASDLRSAITRAHSRAQSTLIATATDQPLPRADGSPARGSLADRSGCRTVRSFAAAWPPNLIHFQPPPAQRPQPAFTLPGKACAGASVREPGDGAGAWSASLFAAPRSAQEDCVNRPRIS